MASRASERWRRPRVRFQKQRLESLPSVLFCGMPPQSIPHQPHRRRLVLLPSRPHRATLEVKCAAAREAILSACLRRKLKALLGALGAAAQHGLNSDDDAVAKGETLKVSRVPHLPGYIVCLISLLGTACV